MKKIIVPILSLLLLSACGNQTGNKTTGTDADSVAMKANAGKNQTKEAAKAAVEAAYNLYFNPADEQEGDAPEGEITLLGISFMDKYMSNSFKELIVMAYDEQVESDEIFFDYDPWVNAQDWDNPTLKSVSITDYSDQQATAEVSFTNFGEDRKAYVVVEYDKEKDAWLICDFLDPEDKESYSVMLKEFISNSDK